MIATIYGSQVNGLTLTPLLLIVEFVKSNQVSINSIHIIRGTLNYYLLRASYF